MISTLYFIINPGSGNQQMNHEEAVRDFFKDTPYTIYIYKISAKCRVDEIKEEIAQYRPDRVIAVGGDGTVKLAAECLIGSNIPLAIVPTGSANGMAREFNIKNNMKDALRLSINGTPRAIHALTINGELSVHLADIGINARMVKRFQSSNERGMLGYAKATWQAFKRHKKMHVSIHANDKTVSKKAEMVVIANGTSYGTGVKINKIGSLFDDQFEVIIVKWFSLFELLKMWLGLKQALNPFKTEIIQTKKITLSIKENTFFQVDGEYIGKVKQVEATIIPKALYLVAQDEAEII